MEMPHKNFFQVAFKFLLIVTVEILRLCWVFFWSKFQQERTVCYKQFFVLFCMRNIMGISFDRWWQAFFFLSPSRRAALRSRQSAGWSTSIRCWRAIRRSGFQGWNPTRRRRCKSRNTTRRLGGCLPCLTCNRQRSPAARHLLPTCLKKKKGRKHKPRKISFVSLKIDQKVLGEGGGGQI